jgi:hypothetical protein
VSAIIASPDAAFPAAPLKSKRLAYFWTGLFILLVIAELWYAPSSALFWERWEIGSLLTAIVFSVVFYVRLFWKDLHKGLTGPQMGAVVLFLLLALCCMGSATLVTSSGLVRKIIPSLSATTNLSAITLAFLSCGMLCFGCIDGVFALRHTNQLVKDEFARGLFFNAIPVFISFMVLLIFALLFPVSAANHEQLKSFIGGAIAFEVLTGNTVFVVLFWQARGA